MRSLLGFIILFLLLSAILTISAAEIKLPGQYADYLFQNGYVYTVDPGNPVSEAVAVKGSQIIFVGNSSDAEQYSGPETRIINLSGRMLMPGFIDGHNHIISGSLLKSGVKLTGSQTTLEIIQRIEAYVRSNPDLQVYTGYDWEFPMFQGAKPTRHDLDKITDKPMIIFNEDTHNAWFNTQAMKMANLSKDTKNPSPTSYYEREPDGTPSGLAYETEAFQPMLKALNVMNGSISLEREMEEIIPTLPRAGITSVHDMGIFTENGLSEGYLGFSLLQKWEKEGKLPVRVTGVYGLRVPTKTAEDHIAILKQWKKTYTSDLIKINGLKIWIDGTYPTYTAVLLQPYENNPNVTGESNWTEPLLENYIQAAYKSGFDVHFHTIGDASVRRALDAFERSQQYRPSSVRATLHHLTLIHPDDLPRFKQLNITGDATLEWLISDWGLANEYFGEKRRDQEYDVWNRLLELGVNVTFGSDIPGTNPDEIAPLYQMQIILTGKIPGKEIISLPPDWRIPTRENLIFGYTAAGAYQMGKEDEIGTITSGKKADFIILDQNIMTVPAENLNKTKILMTMMNGNITYSDPVLG